MKKQTNLINSRANEIQQATWKKLETRNVMVKNQQSWGMLTNEPRLLQTFHQPQKRTSSKRIGPEKKLFFLKFQDLRWYE